jgi:hypothetical protein
MKTSIPPAALGGASTRGEFFDVLYPRTIAAQGTAIGSASPLSF